MITDEMIDASATALEGISFTGKVSPVNGNLEINIDSELSARVSLEAAYPLIRKQVLKEVNDALQIGMCSTEVSKGVKVCQRIVCDMMEGGE